MWEELCERISVWMSNCEIGADVFLSLGLVSNGGRFDSEFEIPYKILVMKKLVMKILTEDFIMPKFVYSTDPAVTQEAVQVSSS